MKDEESHPGSSFHSSDAEMQKEPDGWEEIDDNGAPKLNSMPTTDEKTGERGTRTQKEEGEEKVETSTGKSSVTTVATLTANTSQLNLTDQNKKPKCKKKPKKPKAVSDGEGSNDGKPGIDATSKSQSTGTVADGQTISKGKPTAAKSAEAVSESPPNPTDDAAASGTSSVSSNKGKPLSPISLKMNLLVVVLLAVFGQMQGVSGLLTTLPANVLAKSGAEVRLRCSTDLTDPVYWLRRLHGASETQTLYYGSLGFTSSVNGRFKIDRSRDKGSYDVIIRNVTAKDAGVYVCHDDGGMGERKEMQLIVFEYFNCTMPMPLVGFVGQSDIAEDEIRASCSLKYHGNQKPRFQWRWNDNSMTDSTEESNESTTVVSKVMTQPRKELNGAKLTCTASVSVSVSDGSDAQDSSATVQWTSPQVTILPASLQPGNVEQCKGSSLILVCNSECEYMEAQLNDGLCQCVATYKGSEGQQREFAFSIYSCDGSSWNTLILIIAIVGVAVVISAIAAIVVTRRKINGNGNPEDKGKKHLEEQPLANEDRNGGDIP